MSVQNKVPVNKQGVSEKVKTGEVKFYSKLYVKDGNSDNNFIGQLEKAF